MCQLQRQLDTWISDLSVCVCQLTPLSGGQCWVLTDTLSKTIFAVSDSLTSGLTNMAMNSAAPLDPSVIISIASVVCFLSLHVFCHFTLHWISGCSIASVVCFLSLHVSCHFTLHWISGCSIATVVCFPSLHVSCRFTLKVVGFYVCITTVCTYKKAMIAAGLWLCCASVLIVVQFQLICPLKVCSSTRLAASVVLWTWLCPKRMTVLQQVEAIKMKTQIWGLGWVFFFSNLWFSCVGAG